MDYQTLAISECLAKNLLSTWLSFITWNQLFAVVGIIISVLLTVPRELLLAREMSQFSSCVHSLPHALMAKASHLPFTSSSCVCCYLSARTGSHPSDVEKWILLYFGRLLGQQPRSKPQTNVIWGWIYYTFLEVSVQCHCFLTSFQFALLGQTLLCSSWRARVWQHISRMAGTCPVFRSVTP